MLLSATGRPEGGTCPRRDLFDGDDDDEVAEKVVDSGRMSPDRMGREKAQGGRDRDRSRSISGVDDRQRCSPTQRCNDQAMCMTPPMDSKY